LLTLVPASFAQDKTTYTDHVRPLLQSRCFSCHNPDKKKGGLDVTSYAGLVAGGSGGAVADGGNHSGSRLWTLTARKAEPFMPPEGDPLKPAELDLVARWIDGGLLETASSVVRKTDKPKLDLVVSSTGKPEGPPPMPEDVRLEPVVLADRANAVTALAASPWAPLLAVGGTKQVLLFHADTLELAGVFPYPEGLITSLRFSRNGALLVAAGGHGALQGNVVLFDVKTGRRVAEIGKELDTVLAADLRANHSMVAFGTPGKKLKVCDLAGNELYVKDKHSDWVTAVAFSPDGVLLASGDRNGGLRVWESDAGGEYLNLEAHKAAITALAWRPDSNVLASSSEDGDVILWEMNNGAIVKRWTAHGGGTLGVDYSHDGKLVTSGRDRHIKTWKGDGTLIKDIAETPDLPTKVAFLHDNTRVAAGLWTGDVPVWMHDTAQALGRALQNPPALDTRIAARNHKFAELTSQAKAAEQASAATEKTVAATEKTLADSQQRGADLKTRVAQLRKDLAGAEKQLAEAEGQAANLAQQLAAQRKDLETKRAAGQKLAAEVQAQEKALATLQAAKFNLGVLSEKERLAELEQKLAEARQEAQAAVTQAEQTLSAQKARVEQLQNQYRSLLPK
jgi:WD40 repeat protein